jgi:hypothetical protein
MSVRKRTIPTDDRRARRSYCRHFPVEGVAWSAQRIPTTVNLAFLDQRRYCFFQVAPQPHEAEWTPFQTHYLAENVVVPEIEPGTSGYVARICGH